MIKQEEAAYQAMSDWLADEHELGKPPVKMVCASEFDLHGLHYYIYKFKKSLLGKWLLGVCGGYQEGSLEHCGHIFSEMEPYHPDLAREQAEAMVEGIREYWKKQAQQQKPPKPLTPHAQPRDPGKDGGGREHPGALIGFVLMRAAQWDEEQFRQDLQQRWGMTIENEIRKEGGPVLVWSAGGMPATVSLLPSPVPDGEAEYYASSNYLWPEAEEAAKAHTAQLMVVVLPHGNPQTEAGKTFVKICSACLMQPEALGLYTAGTVFQPKFYCQAAELMKEDRLPVFNWIYFGLYRTEGGMNGYTYGMRAFGKEEMEILDSPAGAQEVRDFLADVACYVLSEDVALKDGETIGFSPEQKILITQSKGVSVDGSTIKIHYEKRAVPSPVEEEAFSE